MSWQDGQARKTDADEAGALTVIEPELVLEMQSSRPFAAPDESSLLHPGPLPLRPEPCACV